jgi:ABC-type multidrug transport system fused ATPase/permease subunit
LFKLSIRDNLKILNPQATDRELYDALLIANAYTFVMDLPSKLDTVIGEKAINISGGQKQRLCLARAFLLKPDLLILDEATSSLDEISENLIRQSIRKFSENTATLVISHSSVFESDADFIYRFNGKNFIKEDGIG